jgi:tRNA pseudouridine38-40 synthase
MSDQIELDSIVKQADPCDSDLDLENDSIEPAEEGKYKGFKKERVAILFGYIGAGYQGLQKNPNAKTIEDELEKAIFAAGAISESNFGFFQKTGWNRAARTDKGVHAAGQIISLRLMVKPNGYNELTAAINSHLPPAIRCFGVFRVTNNFNSKNLCSSRMYDYILPTFVLASPKPMMYISKIPPMSEAMKKAIRERELSLMKEDGASSFLFDSYATGEAFVKAELEQRLSIAGYRKNNTWWDVSPVSSFHISKSKSSNDFNNKVSVSLNDFQTGVAFFKAEEAIRSSLRKLYVESQRDDSTFRIDKSTLQKLRDIWGKFKGTHAFHNFTPRLTFGDATTVRFIMETQVSDPVVITTQVSGRAVTFEYVRLSVMGQSFLLNQIRHMVGLSIDMVRGTAPNHSMETVFSHGLVKLPLAPAEGLYLDYCNFAAYDRRIADATHPPLSFPPEPASSLREEFKKSIIWSHIAQCCAVDKPFHVYIKNMEQEPCTYQMHAPRGDVLGKMQQQQNNKRKRDENSMKEAGSDNPSLGFFSPVDPSIYSSGSAVSKIAKQKFEYKKNFQRNKHILKK